MHRLLIGHYRVMRKINFNTEVVKFLNQLVNEVQLENKKFQANFLNTKCIFYLGKSVPHPDLISTAFLNEEPDNAEISIYVSSNSHTFSLANCRILELIKDLHPITNKFGNYRFSLDPSGNFVYVYSRIEKIGAVWISPTVYNTPEMLITPFRTLISWVLEEMGGIILHASSFTVNSQNVLLAGPSGSGKSTIAFEALTHSEAVICDDAIALTLDGCFPIYGKLKMKSIVDSIEIAGSQFRCERVGTKSILNLSQVSNLPKYWYRPDFLLFPSLSTKSEFVEISLNETIKNLISDSSSETLGTPIGALKLIHTSLNDTRMFNWKLDPDPNLNWKELNRLVTKA